MREKPATQREVLEKMVAGWALCVSISFDSRVWLQQNGCGRGGTSRDVHRSSFTALRQKKLVILERSDFPTSCWELTAKGREPRR